MTKGYKSTEFWVTAVTLVGTFVAGLAGSLPAPEGAAVAGGLALAYTLARSVVKVLSAFASTEK